MSVLQIKMAEAVRQACIEAALMAHENAALDGLCHEGAWECAVDAMRGLDVAKVVSQFLQTDPWKSARTSSELARE